MVIISFITKVSNLDIIVLIKQQIFWFEVSMDYHVSVTVVDTWDDLLEKSPSCILLQLQIINVSIMTAMIKTTNITEVHVGNWLSY